MNEVVNHDVEIMVTAYTHEEHSVDVMEITVLPAPVVDVFTRHADLRAVENRRLGCT